MLTPKQISLYWRTWAAVCAEMGWKNSDSEHRHALHAQAKCKPSMKDFGNGDMDRFLSACRQLLGSRETPTTATEDGERKRLIWRIRKDAKIGGLDDAYLNKIAADQFGLACWEELCIADLTHLRNTFHNRAGKRIGHDTRTPTRRHMVLDPDKVFTPKPKPEPVAAHVESDPF